MPVLRYNLDHFSHAQVSGWQVGDPIAVGMSVGTFVRFINDQFGRQVEIDFPNNTQDVVDATRYVGIESITVPANTANTLYFSGANFEVPFRVNWDLIAEQQQQQQQQSEKDKNMTAAREIMKKFAKTTSLRQAIDLIRCGFEFEFHALNCIRRDTDEGEIDYDADYDHGALYANASRAFSRAGIAEIVDWFSQHPNSDTDYNNIILDGEGKSQDEINKLIVARGYSPEKFHAYTDRMREAWIGDWMEAELEESPENYYPRRKSDYENELSVPSEVRRLIEIGDDNSVDGGEIRTRGARTITEFLKAARALSKNDFEVGVNTSFHIHLSLPGVEHTYGDRFQAEMYAYLLKQYRRWPDGVQERAFHKDGGGEWAQFQLRNGHKYVAIHRHPELGTWEFRLFGNVDKYWDMYRCLALAVGALRHAYQVKFEMTDSLIYGISSDTLKYCFNKLYDDLAPELFFKYLKTATENYNSIESEAA